MKILRNVILLVFCTLTIVKAQTASEKTLKRKFIPPNEKSTVKDSTGRILPYEEWHKILTNGNGNLRSNPNDSTYLMVKVSNEERDAHIKLWKPFESEAFKVGEQITPFKAKAIDGYKFDIKELAGKIVVLNFWFIGCEPCREEIPALNELVRRYLTHPDVIFIAVALDERSQIQEFLKGNPFIYHIISDGRNIAGQFNLHFFPANVVVDREGKINFSSRGGNYANPYWMKKSIDELLNK